MTAMKDWIQHEIAALRRHSLALEMMEAILAQTPPSVTRSELCLRATSERAAMTKEIAFAERMRLKPQP